MTEDNLNVLKEMLVEMEDGRKAVTYGEDWETYLIKRLADTHEAIGYLKAAIIEVGELDVFLLALRHVIKAQVPDEIGFTPVNYCELVKVLRAVVNNDE